MKPAIVILCTTLAIACATTSAAPGPDEIRPVVSDRRVPAPVVWTDRGDGATYNVGDPIRIYFRTDADCYLMIYDIATDGRVRLLFPQWPDDGFVSGGMTYRLPEYYGGDALRVSGPRGLEFIHAVAVRRRGAFRYGVADHTYTLGVGPVTGDPYEAINAINTRLLPARAARGAATTSFFVGGPVWYPRYLCASCHEAARYDPYLAPCPRYEVSVVGEYDYWWRYDYQPLFTHAAYAGPFWSFAVRVGPIPGTRVHFVDCAWGYRNYHPRLVPTVTITHVAPHHSRADEQRTYQRDATAITYESHARTYGTGGTQDRSRTRDDRGTSAGGSTSTDRSRGESGLGGARTSDGSTGDRDRTGGTSTGAGGSDAVPSRTRLGPAPTGPTLETRDRTAGGAAVPGRVTGATPDARSGIPPVAPSGTQRQTATPVTREDIRAGGTRVTPPATGIRTETRVESAAKPPVTSPGNVPARPSATGADVRKVDVPARSVPAAGKEPKDAGRSRGAAVAPPPKAAPTDGSRNADRSDDERSPARDRAR